ncbi:MAG TPA: isoprenylcysteine carboxylmethyltransferase family protein [Candidatus Binatia bacterium]|nr:isoprenylcysteine carboxylmethyltransferase family protein [Candidatus Binatia bacterium]
MRSLRSAIDILGMLACSVYCTIPLFWLVVHPFIDRWRRRGRRAYAFVLPVWSVFIALAFLFAWLFRFARFYANWLAWAPAALLFLLGFSIYSAAFRSFHHTQVSGLAELEPERHRQQLVTTGIRSRVRHPIYLGHLCEIFAWCIGTGLIALYVLAAFALATGAWMIRIEDRELEARFGEEYRAYRRTVPAVVPRLRRQAAASLQ